MIGTRIGGIWPAVAFSVALATTPSRTADAGGMAIPGSGPQPQARAGAFVAKADDPSALLHNVAGFAKLDGTVITLGANFVDFSLSYQRTGRYETTNDHLSYEGLPYPEIHDSSRPDFGIGGFQAIPTIAIGTDFGRPELPIRVAFGIFTPQGYPSRKYPLEIDMGVADLAPGPMRYDIIEQKATVILPSVVVAWKATPQLDVGARLSVGYGSVQGKKGVWSVRNYEESPGRDTVFALDGSDPFIGSYPYIPAFGAGVLYRPTNYLELGASYSSKLEIRTEGIGVPGIGSGIGLEITTQPLDDKYTRCAKGGVVGALKACVNLDIPQMATIGGRYIFRDSSGGERADVELDVRWEDWSASTNTQFLIDGEINVEDAGYLTLNPLVNRHGYQDVFSFRLGGAYNFPVAGNKLIVRAGTAYDTRTAPASWARVDIDGKRRLVLTTGLGFETSRFRIDVGGGVVLEPDITVAQCSPPDGPTFTNPGCDGSGKDTPVRERTSPDPAQALQGPYNQIQSPFNAGLYQSGYVLLSAGVTFWY